MIGWLSFARLLSDLDFQEELRRVDRWQRLSRCVATLSHHSGKTAGSLKIGLCANQQTGRSELPGNPRLVAVGVAEPLVADRQEKLPQPCRTRNGPARGMTDLAVSTSTQVAVIRNSVAKPNHFRLFETSSIAPADEWLLNPILWSTRSLFTRAWGARDTT
ncbi:uncharacterized protein LY79DRAFT_236136 [Colletotrichum navitas]|uniref:Uncharacterized protein n=1 Tax=Colletotrichum navitas TaxID=681940 RepID=A0AAD8PXZ0_9PEZI|nr:uncharacterized protein LY79DRAFT_236136 [Colletotrichum navitas]KAK1589614.1 hypothetical protein LY79DRAFT_236136 [Colletotrichum navitas]